jgi:hypothetical protein
MIIKVIFISLLFFKMNLADDLTLAEKKVHIHAVTDYLTSKQVNSVIPKAMLIRKSKVASELAHPDFIQSLIDHANLRSETKH